MRMLRKSSARGQTRTGWLDSRHSFSFGDYHDPAHVGFGALRVINEDTIAPSTGFPMHGHRDMEIITYVLSGALEHKDSLGSGSIIRPGEVQVMRAGSGIRHSERNPSHTQSVHLLQIWIMPDTSGLLPAYQQKTFAAEEMRTKFHLIVSPDGEGQSLTIAQNAKIYAASLAEGEATDFLSKNDRKYWLHIATGSIVSGKDTFAAGDGLAIQNEASSLDIIAQMDSELLLFDLAP